MFKVGLIGCGNMGEAIVKGLIGSGKLKSVEIIVSDVNPQRVEYMVEMYNVAGSSTNRKVVENSEIIILAVKPKDLETTIQPIRELFKDKILISVLAGTPISKIKKIIKEGFVIRAMPNTPALIGEGAIGVSLEREERYVKEKVIDILSSLGIVVEV